MSGHDPPRALRADMMMDQDQIGAQAEALQAQHVADVPEDQQHQVDLEGDMMEDIVAVEAPRVNHHHHHHQHQPLNQIVSQSPQSAGLLLRHASQSSLDESSQRQKGAETRRPPYKNGAHSGKALEGMNSMRLSGLLCDVTLVADSTEIPAQKVCHGHPMVIISQLMFRLSWLQALPTSTPCSQGSRRETAPGLSCKEWTLRLFTF